MKHGIDELKKLLYKFKTMSVSEYTELYNASLSRDQIKVFDDRPQVLRMWQNELGLFTFNVNQDVDCLNDF